MMTRSVLRAVLLLGACLGASAVPASLAPRKEQHKGGKQSRPAVTAAAAADLITDLPGAPDSVNFKQYAGKHAPGPRADAVGVPSCPSRPAQTDANPARTNRQT
jgi:hypothetical protein